MTESSQQICWKLEIAYLGFNYCGWQSQPDGSAVQDHIEKALKILLRQEVRILGASRTDSGVHAEHQVASFNYAKPIDKEKFLKSCQGLLPADIAILDITEAPPDFHPIVTSTGKIYRYRIWREGIIHPFVKGFVWAVPSRVDWDVFFREAKVVEGVHNFRSFCASDSSVQTFEREIYSVHVDDRGPLIDVWIMGSGFLKQMVRALVGTLIDIASGKLDQDMNSILMAKDRTVAGRTAPASGLTLVRILYENPLDLRTFSVEQGQGFAFGLHRPVT